MGCTPAQEAYRGVPLAAETAAHRGVILEEIVRRAWEAYAGEATCDALLAEDAACVNGRKRARGNTSCDFLGGACRRRFEVKTAQLSWVHTMRRWEVKWCKIKREAHDVLLLALFAPSGLYIFKHDGSFGVSTNGRSQASTGGKVQINGAAGETCIERATRTIVDRMRAMLCVHLPCEELLAIGERGVSTTTQRAYEQVPLSAMPLKRRGVLIEGVARRVWEEHAGETTLDPVDDEADRCANGHRRSRGCASYDFLDHGGRRFEVKSAQLRWNQANHMWCAHWMHIKPGAHDCLLLALYTPSGLHLFRHDGMYGVTTHGCSQGSSGGGVSVYGPRGECAIERATEVVLGKLRPMFLKTLRY